ncbi:hypothetical protein Lal_00021921 [Lupinus albus]|nr:hypothetical protein Lal_00021921 [Lupinus albus]
MSNRSAMMRITSTQSFKLRLRLRNQGGGELCFPMKLATLNIRGLGRSVKKRVLRSMVRKEKLDFLSIHETKLESIDYNLCSKLWDGSDFDWAFQPSIGRSGGLLSIWRTAKFH